MNNQPIELRIREARQLFHSLDPLPFRERDLDQDVEDYVVGWAQELPHRVPLEIVVHLPAAEGATAVARQIPDAVRNYFAHRADNVRRELRELFRFGRRTLLIGLAVLALCLALAALTRQFASETFVGRFLQEGLFLVGWVANWRPIEIFLYEWIPPVRRRRLYLRLAAADIRVALD